MLLLRPRRRRRLPCTHTTTTTTGNSVCLFVHGFEPYFYADCPADFTPEECSELCRVLQVRLQLM